MFILEALQARHGDCLLLRWGSGSASHLALIDGGPVHTYEDVLRPRLLDLSRERGTKVPLELVMVTHVDDDHIKGVLSLADEVVNGEDAPVDVRRVWHNGLDDVLDDTIREDAAVRTDAEPSKAAARVLASLSQGRALDEYIEQMRLGLPRNHPFRSLVAANGRSDPVVISGLALTVIAPDTDELEALRVEWRKRRPSERSTAAYADRSVFNQSSIVVLAAFGGRRMLLTGDARGDLVLTGLQKAGLLDNGRLHVDLLKVPHHASPNNLSREFFEAVTADVYVVSGTRTTNGAALRWIADARGDACYEVACTYDLPHARTVFGRRMRAPCGTAKAIIVDLSRPVS